MLFPQPLPNLTPLRQAICDLHLAPETDCIETLLTAAKLTPTQLTTIQNEAKSYIEAIRAASQKNSGLDSFLAEYDLSSTEGIALMCLAEALLRIPDDATIDALIRDKIVSGNWSEHIGESDSLFVNSATWALMLTGKILEKEQQINWKNTLKDWMAKRSEPVIRSSIRQAMRILGKQFVFAETIQDALGRARKEGGLYSFDMLGEAALTADDAKMYFDAYAHAIHELAKAAKSDNPFENHGVSVKISALSPRYDYWEDRLQRQDWIDKVLELAVLAKRARIGFTIDAEEADRLEISLDILEAVFKSKELKDFSGFGLAVQAYQKRAPAVIDWLNDLAKNEGKPIAVRLVKGAYWDSEIKRAQESGLPSYPVFTRKVTTDVSYIACAKKLLAESNDIFYSQFATHNAFTLAAIRELAGPNKQYEFQRLHGMGEALYNSSFTQDESLKCRVYAPVGGYQYLLAYLVRRLLENGANTSFVNRIQDKSLSLQELVANPVQQLTEIAEKSHPKIPVPRKLFGESRLNSKGIILSNTQMQKELQQLLTQASQKSWKAFPLTSAKREEGKALPVYNPGNLKQQIGSVTLATDKDVQNALEIAQQAQENWSKTPVEIRARCLEKTADLFEENMPELLALAILEAGKSLPNAIAEVREAIDFCRYYANSAREYLSKPQTLPGPTGENNILEMHGRGVFACISPWNFPLAIFIGQITAALVTGNAVVAKPAEQTPLIAHRAIELLLAAGIPAQVLHCLPGNGETVGAALVADKRIAGVMFTGSTETARLINQTLASKTGPIVPFVAETGGQNAMIVDSSALPEQVVTDVVRSAFDSAGQRCSALRVLCVQSDIADRIIPMLTGAMKELVVNNPSEFTTDIGPVIDDAARQMLVDHCERMDKEAKLLYRVELPNTLSEGFYFAPCAYQLNSISQLKREVFGPVLHVIVYERDKLGHLIDEINNTGYGLTFGVHSRIQDTIDFIVSRIKVGNVYVNRNIIGAVVGVQPFGGCGLSGTGPKAGGPHYLLRLCEEKVISTNTVAMGGNASLLSLE
jgi:RHH-type proline utilization regulon transcriptional repressor/proline dehydrogenase/delta 1-pyrroline-5-carboxylate dehydrogenase